ncbi:unnamed protein product [Caenorhabditis nigoni]
MSSMNEMPELVLENIIGFLDFRGVLTIRQVCVDFRNFIDDLKGSKLPDSNFFEIRMTVDSDKNIHLIYRDPLLHTSLARSEYAFIYSEAENSRSFKGKTTYLGNSNVVDVAVRDLELVLKCQKSKLYDFSYWKDYHLLNDPSVHNLPFELSNFFKKLNRKIKAKLLTVRMESQSEIMSILSFMEPETLEKIEFLAMDEEMVIEINEIVKTEQWKRANKLYCTFDVSNLNVEDVSYFPEVNMQVLSISARDLDFLRKTYIRSFNFKSSWLKVRKLVEKRELSNYWGPSFHHRPYSFWYFRMKNSEENILRIMIKRYRRTDIFFQIIQLEDVPTRAIVQGYQES